VNVCMCVGCMCMCVGCVSMCVCGYLVSAFLAYSHTYLHTHTHSGHSIRGLRGVPALRVPHLQHPASPRQGIFCSVNACVYECAVSVCVCDHVCV
jgi:hypothetical protein